MNRSIEFRVWDKGKYYLESEIAYITNTGKMVLMGGNILINPTILQFTGLLDVDNVKIFEGDIVEFYDGFAECVSTANGWELNPDDIKTGVIGYSDKIGSFVILGKDNKSLILYKGGNKTYHYSIENAQEIKVIGNRGSKI